MGDGIDVKDDEMTGTFAQGNINLIVHCHSNYVSYIFFSPVRAFIFLRKLTLLTSCISGIDYSL
jgi:hypothetical protein